MKLAIAKESRPDETRVAATPETVKKLIGLGFEVTVEKGAGTASSIPDALFKDAGAKIAKDAATALGDADVVFKVLRPTTGDGGEVGLMKSGAVLAAIMAPFADRETVDACAGQGVQAFAMELMPRITRAQSMDVLSSQSNLAGYRAVIDGAYEFGRAFPMMMTAAGTVAPARIVVMGAGVAGLQAIATARRLGAVVSAFDVRPVAKEQVESLGAKFIEVESAETADAETAAGYAKEMSKAYQEKQREVIHETLKKSDIVITTALIPGKPAPLLVTKETVAEMRPGSVIVDLASEAGGNCELTEHGKIITRGGVKIVGHANVPGRLASNASALYAKNLLNFVTLMVDTEKQELAIDWEDEIITGTALTRDGEVVHPALTGEGE